MDALDDVDHENGTFGPLNFITFAVDAVEIDNLEAVALIAVLAVHEFGHLCMHALKG